MRAVLRPVLRRSNRGLQSRVSHSWAKWKCPCARLFSGVFAASWEPETGMSPDDWLKFRAAFGLCPLWFFHVGTGDVATRSPSLVRVFRALGRTGRGSGAQLVFSSILQVMERAVESKRRAQDLAPGFVLHQNFVFYTDLRVFFKTQGVLGPDGIQCADGGTLGLHCVGVSAQRQPARELQHWGQLWDSRFEHSWGLGCRKWKELKLKQELGADTGPKLLQAAGAQAKSNKLASRN